MSTTKFKKGDIVRFIGGQDEWVLDSVWRGGVEYVDIHCNSVFVYNVLADYLELVRRPKRKVTKTIEVWANVYPGNLYTRYTKEHAESCAMPGRIACVKLTGSYEIEVDDGSEG